MAARDSDANDKNAEITAEAEQARFRLEVTRQRVRITKDQLQHARELYKEARKEAKRARKKAASARRKWRTMRKRVSHDTAKAVKRKAKRSALLKRTPGKGSERRRKTSGRRARRR